MLWERSKETGTLIVDIHAETPTHGSLAAFLHLYEVHMDQSPEGGINCIWAIDFGEAILRTTGWRLRMFAHVTTATAGRLRQVGRQM